MSLDQAAGLSWEQLTAQAAARRRKDAAAMLQFMVAAQGDDKSWKSQIKELKKILK